MAVWKFPEILDQTCKDHCASPLSKSCTMWGLQDSVQLANITPITMVYGTYNYIYIYLLGLINQLITGGPHIVCMLNQNKYIHLSAVLYIHYLSTGRLSYVPCPASRSKRWPIPGDCCVTSWAALMTSGPCRSWSTIWATVWVSGTAKPYGVDQVEGKLYRKTCYSPSNIGIFYTSSLKQIQWVGSRVPSPVWKKTVLVHC